jgi:hypothetical protein
MELPRIARITRIRQEIALREFESEFPVRGSTLNTIRLALRASKTATGTEWNEIALPQADPKDASGGEQQCRRSLTRSNSDARASRRARTWMDYFFAGAWESL